MVLLWSYKLSVYSLDKAYKTAFFINSSFSSLAHLSRSKEKFQSLKSESVNESFKN